MYLLRERLHSDCCGDRLRFQQRRVHAFETGGSLNNTFMESVLVVCHRLPMRNWSSSMARYSEMTERTSITWIIEFTVATGPWNGIPARDLSTFCKSCTIPCQVVRIAWFVDESCEGPFAGRVVESGVVDVMELELAAADATAPEEG